MGRVARGIDLNAPSRDFAVLFFCAFNHAQRNGARALTRNGLDCVVVDHGAPFCHFLATPTLPLDGFLGLVADAVAEDCFAIQSQRINDSVESRRDVACGRAHLKMDVDHGPTTVDGRIICVGLRSVILPLGLGIEIVVQRWMNKEEHGMVREG